MSKRLHFDALSFKVKSIVRACNVRGIGLRMVFLKTPMGGKAQQSTHSMSENPKFYNVMLGKLANLWNQNLNMQTIKMQINDNK